MEDYIEQQEIHIPLNELNWDLEAMKFQSRPLDLHKLQANPLIRPLSCIVWRDEGMPMHCPSCKR